MMASASEESPRITVEIVFDRLSHSFSQPSPPILTLTLTSHAKTPLTLFTWGTPFSLPRALTSNGFVITDTSSGQNVKTSLMQVQRTPLKRTRGSPDEQYFLTLQPESPVHLSTGFGRGGGGVKPQPKSVVERGLEVDANGNEVNLRRSKSATGVDGLEPGRKYEIGLNTDLLDIIRWAPAEKEDILVEGTGEGSNVQDYEWNKGSLNFSVRQSTLSVET
ncbi:hypothetical protein DPSP01_014056 [Paraphaeosphaeria sporulosa]